MKSKKQLESLRVGVAGEHMVLAQMNLQGWDASLTEKNYPMIDIFGRNPETGKYIGVQVKSASTEQKSFLIGFRHDNRDDMQNDIVGPYVFVHFHKDRTADFFIISKEELISLVFKDDDAYFGRKRTKAIRPDYPIAVSLELLKDYNGKWDNLMAKNAIDF